MYLSCMYFCMYDLSDLLEKKNQSSTVGKH